MNEASNTALGQGPNYALAGGNCVDWLQSKLNDLHINASVVEGMTPNETLVFDYATYLAILRNTPFELAVDGAGSVVGSIGKFFDQLNTLILSNFRDTQIANNNDAPHWQAAEVVVTYNPVHDTWVFNPVIEVQAANPGTIVAPDLPSDITQVEVPAGLDLSNPDSGMIGHFDQGTFVPDASYSGGADPSGLFASYDSAAQSGAGGGGDVGGGAADWHQDDPPLQTDAVGAGHRGGYITVYGGEDAPNMTTVPVRNAVIASSAQPSIESTLGADAYGQQQHAETTLAVPLVGHTVDQGHLLAA